MACINRNIMGDSSQIKNVNVQHIWDVHIKTSELEQIALAKQLKLNDPKLHFYKETFEKILPNTFSSNISQTHPNPIPTKYISKKQTTA